MTSNPTCATCRWWGQKDTSSRGDCRRYAPRPALSPDCFDADPLSWWAVTLRDEGCGEHTPRQPTEAEPAASSLDPATQALLAEAAGMLIALAYQIEAEIGSLRGDWTDGQVERVSETAARIRAHLAKLAEDA